MFQTVIQGCNSAVSYAFLSHCKTSSHHDQKDGLGLRNGIISDIKT